MNFVAEINKQLAAPQYDDVRRERQFPLLGYDLTIPVESDDVSLPVLVRGECDGIPWEARLRSFDNADWWGRMPSVVYWVRNPSPTTSPPDSSLPTPFAPAGFRCATGLAF